MNLEKKRVTIYDIAEKCGVSGNTVSRVLNNKDNISPATRELVLNTARELNYFPNSVARSLRNRFTKQILLTVPYVKETFNFSFIATVQEQLQKKGYSMLLKFTQNNTYLEKQALESLHNNTCDGIIITSSNITEELIRAIREVNRPCVLCSYSQYALDKNLPKQMDYVYVDSKVGIYEATKHLIMQGYGRIGYIGPPFEYFEGRERLSGFELAMKEFGRKIEREDVDTNGYDDVYGYEGASRILAQENRPDAIVAGTDLIAHAVYKVAKQEGICIPEDLGVIGMDNLDQDVMLTPELSSVVLYQEQVGSMATDLLLKRIESSTVKEPEKIRIMPRLIVRDSSVGRVKQKGKP